jgi:S1-C subfamily serine protease
MPLVLAVLASAAAAGDLEAQERGFLGINLDCGKEECKVGEQSGAVIWWFPKPPEINWVRGGSPAALGGILPGDVLLAVNGSDITTEEGGRLFGAMRVGVPVQFHVDRDGTDMTLTVTPGTEAEAFGEEWVVMSLGEDWDSLQIRVKQLYESQINLQVALVAAERALLRTEAEARRTSSEQTREQARLQRIQIDSIRLELDDAHKRLRVHADSLAAVTLYVVPRVAPEIQVTVESPDSRTIVMYGDAVAGARFEELAEDSPLVADLGVSEGLLIIKVADNTPAYRSGLRQGDVVLAINGESVGTVSELRRLLSAGEVELTFVRHGKKQTCKIGTKKP